MSGWWTWILDVLGADRYNAHSICLTNDPIIMTLFAASHLATFASYMVIGLTLVIYANRIISMSSRVRALYGTFILLCGGAHLCEVFTLFSGVYRLELMFDTAMAAVSVMTAIFTARELPRVKMSEG